MAIKNLIDKAPPPLEEIECIELASWRDRPDIRRLYPGVETLIHIPMGRARPGKLVKRKDGKTIRVCREGTMLKRMGARSGVVDYLLPVARGNYLSLWFEMKRQGWTERLSDEEWRLERIWLDMMQKCGHGTAVVRGSKEGILLLKIYLEHGTIPEWMTRENWSKIGGKEDG